MMRKPILPYRLLFVELRGLKGFLASLAFTAGFLSRRPLSTAVILGHPRFAFLAAWLGPRCRVESFDRPAVSGLFGTLRTLPQGIMRLLETVRGLRACKVSLSLDPEGGLFSSFFAWASGAPLRAGWRDRRPCNRLFNNRPVAGRVQDGSGGPGVLLGLIGEPGEFLPARPGWHVEAGEEEPAVRFLSENRLEPGRFAILLPASDEYEGVLGDGPCHRIVSQLAQLASLPTVVACPEGNEPARRRVAEIVEQNRQSSLAAPDLDLPGFIALARRAAVCIGQDGGPLHLAAAAGCPTVSIHGPSRAETDGPLFGPTRAVQADISCAGCGRRRCRKNNCFENLDTGRVVGALESLLGEVERDRIAPGEAEQPRR